MIVYHAYHKDFPAFYIGKTVKTLSHRMLQHKNAAKHKRNRSHFHNAIRKYGFDSFEWKILEECQSVEEMNETEKRWIKLLKDCGHKIYNLTLGGDGGDCGGSAFWRGKTIPQETRDKISASLRNYFSENDNPRKGRKTIGRPHSEKAKEKISKSKLGHEVTIATREKLRVANIGKKLSPSVIEVLRRKFSGKNNPSAKAIICTTDGKKYDYAKLAAIEYGVDLSTIIKCCRGKVKKTKGLEFEYQ